MKKPLVVAKSNKVIESSYRLTLNEQRLVLGELKQTSPKFHRILGMTSTFVGLIVP